MKIRIYIINKIKNSAIFELVEYYQKLLSKYAKVGIIGIPDKSEQKIKLTTIAKYLNDSFNIVLSEDGKEFTTSTFASKIESLKLNYSQLNFFVANAYGFDQEVKQKANLVLSLSQMTTGHELALVFLLEQLFRISNLNTGGQYHK